MCMFQLYMFFLPEINVFIFISCSVMLSDLLSCDWLQLLSLWCRYMHGSLSAEDPVKITTINVETVKISL